MYGRNFFQLGNGPHQLSHCHLDSPVPEILRYFVDATPPQSFQYIRHISFKIKPVSREISSGGKRKSSELRYLSDGINSDDEWQRMAKVLLDMPKLDSLQMWIMSFPVRSVQGLRVVLVPQALAKKIKPLSVAGIMELLLPFDEKEVRGQWVLYVPDSILLAVHDALEERKSPFELLRHSPRRGPHWQPGFPNGHPLEY
ncbi:hypothetical protein SLS56_004394 [Neofusicoccum ribis]|uniref:Uncharacterized protein n=1 Tax=Neofusicoccum ribis TaxID=45134 RepID=A0ABR3SWH2_9PEZI